MQPQVLETVNVISEVTNLPCLKCYHVPTIVVTQQIQAAEALALGERKGEVGKTDVKTTRVVSPSHDRVRLLAQAGFVPKLEKRHKFINSIQYFWGNHILSDHWK